MKLRLRSDRFRRSLTPRFIQGLGIIPQPLGIRKIAQLGFLRTPRHQLMQPHGRLAGTGSASKKQRLAFAKHTVILLLAEI